MNTKGYCTEALGYKCVHVRDIDWIFLSNHLVQLAKPSPVRPPGLGGGKAVCPLLSPLQLRHLLLSWPPLLLLDPSSPVCPRVSMLDI